MAEQETFEHNGFKYAVRHVDGTVYLDPLPGQAKELYRESHHWHQAEDAYRKEKGV